MDYEKEISKYMAEFGGNDNDNYIINRNTFKQFIDIILKQIYEDLKSVKINPVAMQKALRPEDLMTKWKRKKTKVEIVYKDGDIMRGYILSFDNYHISYLCDVTNKSILISKSHIRYIAPLE